jgi:mRNA interferase RelE/StbE
MVPVKIRGQIKRRIESLAYDPTPPGSKKIQGVTDGENPVHRVRQGDYRILYSIRNNPGEIVILYIGHRKDVYR